MKTPENLCSLLYPLKTPENFYLHFIPLENTRKPLVSGVFRGYKIGTLVRYGLAIPQKCYERPQKAFTTFSEGFSFYSSF